MRSLAWAQVRARRLARAHLLERAEPEQLVEVVSDVCGVHAQAMSAAELSIAARVDGITQTDVREALWERRELAKTWSLRGTLHLHPAAELPLWTAARRTGEPWHDPGFLAAFGLTADRADAILAAIGDALRGRRLTRQELGDEVAARVGGWAKAETDVIQFGKPALVWPQLLGAAVVTGRLCFGPSRGSRTTFARADEWIEDWHEEDPEAALLEACRRYLVAYGPAACAEFEHWLRPGGDAAAVFAALGGELEQVDLAGRRVWQLAGDEAPAPLLQPPLRLLPSYDCYVIGSAPPGPAREELVPPGAGRRVFDRGSGPFAVLLLDGVAGGVWKGRRSRRRIELEVEPFAPLSRARRADLDAEVERIGRFLGLEPALSIA